MQVVSSKWTLALKLLLPTFWFCAWGGLTISMFFIDLSSIQEPFSPLSARLIMLSFLFTTLAIYYFVFASIKWVALDPELLYVSNFKESYQYTFDSISKIDESKVLFFRKVTVHFHQNGKFGQSITFLSSYYWHYYLKKNPSILQKLLKDWQD